MANTTVTMVRKQVAGRMIEDNYKIQVYGSDSFELVLASDLKQDGSPKYYRSQHLVASRRAKQIKAHGYERSMAMHDRNIARASRKQARAESQRSARRERRQAKKRSNIR